MEEATYFELKPVNYFFTMMASADQSDPPQYPRIITDEEAFSFPPNKRSICFFPVQIPRPPDCSLYQIDPNLSRIGNEGQLSAPSVYYTPYEHLGVADGNLQDSGLVEVEISRRSNNASFESQQDFFDHPINLTPPPFQVDQNPNEEKMPTPIVSSALNSPIEANNENRQQASLIEGSAQLKKKSTSRRAREKIHSKSRPKCNRRRALKGIRRNADSYDVAHDHCYVFLPTDPALAVFSHRKTRPPSPGYSKPEGRRNLSLSPSRSEKSIASTHRRHHSAESIDSVEIETEKSYRYRGRLRENEIPPRTIRTRTDKRKESSVDSSDLPKDPKDIEIDSSSQKTQINNPEPLGRCLRSRTIKTEEPIALNLRSRSRKMQKEENSLVSNPPKEDKNEETPLDPIIVPKEKRDRNPKSRSRLNKKGKRNRSRKPQKEQKDLEIEIVESFPEEEDNDSALIIDDDSTDLTGQLNQNPFFHSSAQKRRSDSQSEEEKTKKKKPNEKMNLEEIHLISSVIVNSLAIGNSNLQIASFCEEIIRDELAIPTSVKEKPKEKKTPLRFGIDAILGIPDKEDDEKKIQIRECFEVITLNSEPQCTPSTETISISDTEEASVDSEKAWLEQKKNEIISNTKRNSALSIPIFDEASSNDFWNIGAKKLKIPLPIVDSTAQDKTLDEIQKVNSHRLRSAVKEKEENSQLVESSKFAGDQELYLVQMNALAAITENLRLQGKVTSKFQKMCAKAANTLQEFGKNL